MGCSGITYAKACSQQISFSRLERASFTIEFPEHLPADRRTYCLNRLSTVGASVTEVSDGVFRIGCSTRNELAQVGWVLFHTHIADLCRVTGTSGDAEAKASAYPQPSKRGPER